ncbi:DNA alkylation repair protein [Candidatus Microgenomates bacterium]|nr:DNA alkylation repair protein [Candidatus Microgenomates bacterium]
MDAQVKRELKQYSTAARAKANAWYFKSGPGQYGAGDIFMGVSVPDQRKVAKHYYSNITLPEVLTLLSDPVHECRLTALFMLVYQFEKTTDEQTRKRIFEFYIKHRAYINNWDLVDSSASHIVGGYLHGKDAALLTKLAGSNSLWDRRIAMISTLYEIVAGTPHEGLRIATILVNDRHDLIQKAVGWMLREIGKRCGKDYLISFLNTHYKTMPRTALRYAIERLSPAERTHYMKK